MKIISSSNAGSKKIAYIDILRIVAMLGVILNHSFGYYSCDNWGEYVGTSIYYVDLTLNAITRFNVPIFIMISGALILGDEKNANIKKIYTIRIKNIVIPLVTWSFIYIILNVSRGGGKYLWGEFAKAMISPRSYSYHLWYIYMLILLYAVTPLIIPLINAGEKYINYFLIFWILFSVVYPLFNHICPQIKLNAFQNYNIAGGYLGYYICGYRISKIKPINTKKCLSIFMCSWAITVACSIAYQNYICGYDGYFLQFLAPNIVIMSVALFLLIKNTVEGKTNSKSTRPMVMCLSRLSFGIYFIHFMIRDFVRTLLEKGYINDYLYFIVSPITVFTLSVSIIYVVSKMKVLQLPIAGVKK